jgi:hypothetical protein
MSAEALDPTGVCEHYSAFYFIIPSETAAAIPSQTHPLIAKKANPAAPNRLRVDDDFMTGHQSC